MAQISASSLKIGAERRNWACVGQANDFDLVVLHTSVPSFQSDVKCVEALKAANPKLKADLIGAKVAVDAEKSLKEAPAIDFVCRNEFDFTCLEVAEDRLDGEVADTRQPGLEQVEGGRPELLHGPRRGRAGG